MVKTRNTDNKVPGQPSTSAQHTTPAQPTSSDPTTEPTQPLGPPARSPSLSILSSLEDDISTLSEEGKTIVNTIIKAVQAISNKKDQIINQLQNKVAVLENKLSDLKIR